MRTLLRGLPASFSGICGVYMVTDVHPESPPSVPVESPRVNYIASWGYRILGKLGQVLGIGGKLRENNNFNFACV